MATCVAVVAYYALDASVKSEAEYSGFVLKVGRPDYFVWGLWTVWTWAAIRYWHQFYANWIDVRGKVLAEVSRQQTRITLHFIVRRATELARSGDLGRKHPKAKAIRLTLSQRDEPDPNTSVRSTFQDDLGTLFFTEVENGEREFNGLNIAIRTPMANGGYEYDHTDFSLRVSKWTGRCIRLRSWISALWRLPAIGEYLAPFTAIALTLGAPLVFPRG